MYNFDEIFTGSKDGIRESMLPKEEAKVEIKEVKQEEKKEK
jgi:hypothetical protein